MHDEVEPVNQLHQPSQWPCQVETGHCNVQPIKPIIILFQIGKCKSIIYIYIYIKHAQRSSKACTEK